MPEAWPLAGEARELRLGRACPVRPPNMASLVCTSTMPGPSKQNEEVAQPRRSAPKGAGAHQESGSALDSRCFECRPRSRTKVGAPTPDPRR